MITHTRTLRDIAADIRTHWTDPAYDAVPYIEALECLDDTTQFYGLDSGRAICAYFLSRAESWRGEDAVRIKAELRRMIGRSA